MREGKRSVWRKVLTLKLIVENLFLRTHNKKKKKTIFYFSYPRANSTFNSSLIYKPTPDIARRSLPIRVSGKGGGKIERRMNESGERGEGSFEKKLWKKRSEEGKSA